MKNLKQDIQTLAHDVTYHPSRRLDLFQKQKTPIQVEIFFRVSPHVQQTLLEALSVKELVTFVDQLDLDEAGKILARIKNEKKRKSVAIRLKQELREKAEFFLQFSPKAEFSLLSFNYILLPADTTIGEVSHLIDLHYKETGKSPEVLVHEKGVCIGEVQAGTLVRERNTSKLKKYISPIISIEYKASLKEIKKVFNLKNQKKKVVVQDTDKSVIGIIYVDDVLKLFKNGSTEALYDFAGVSDTERVFDPVISKVEHRYKWLLVNLATGFFAAWIVSLFKNTLNEYVLLAMYMPIVAGMGGNAASQTLAVIVRGISMGEVSLGNVKKAIWKEVKAGFLNGFITGVIVAFVASYFNHSPLLGLIVGIALLLNLVVAGLFGALVPVIMKSFGKDPATSAIIFITTATDVLGFLVFLGLASIFVV
jgi:magnesium transporter